MLNLNQLKYHFQSLVRDYEYAAQAPLSAANFNHALEKTDAHFNTNSLTHTPPQDEVSQKALDVATDMFSRVQVASSHPTHCKKAREGLMNFHTELYKNPDVSGDCREKVHALVQRSNKIVKSAPENAVNRRRFSAFTGGPRWDRFDFEEA